MGKYLKKENKTIMNKADFYCFAELKCHWTSRVKNILSLFDM